MARGIMAGPAEAQNAHKKVGPGEAEAQIWFTNPRGAGPGFIAGEKTDIGGVFSQLGGFVGFLNPSAGKAYPKGDKAPSNPRGTKSVLAGTADASKPTTMVMKVPEGSGMTVLAGGDSKSTILVATGDGQNGMLITAGFVALYTMGTELILHGYAGKITSTYHLIQETNKGAGKVLKQTYGYTDA